MVEEKKEEEEILEKKPQEEGETLEEETSKEEQETSTKEPEKGLSELEKKVRERTGQLYRRAMEAEEELERTKKAKPSEIPSDVFDLAKTVSSLKDYNPKELDYIQLIAKAKGISPEEAAKTEEAKLYISARRQKVEAEKKTPEPSTKVSPSEKSADKITVEDMRKMSPEDRRKTLIKKGWIKERR